MTITYRGSGSGSNSQTGPNPTHPGTVEAGDIQLLVVTSGGSTDPTPDTPSGWDFRATANGGEGTYGLDVGPRRTTVYTLEAVGTEDGATVAVNVTDGNTARGQIHGWGRTESTWSIATATATMGTDSTALSFTFGALDVAAGDVLAICFALNNNGADPDSATQALSGSGLTFGAITEQVDNAVNNGLDHRHLVYTSDVATGSGTVAITYTQTLDNAASGSAVLVRIRETAGAGAAELATDSTAGATLAATGATIVELATASTASATLAGSAAAVAELAADSSAGATLSGTAGAAPAVAELATDSTAAATLTGTAAAVVELAGDSSAGATLAGTAAVVAELAADSSAGATASGAAAAIVELAADSSAGATLNGTAGQVALLAADSTAAATLSASGAVVVELAADSSAAATLVGSAAVIAELGAGSSAGATLTGTGSAVLPVVELAATSSASATLSGTAGGVTRLAVPHRAYIATARHRAHVVTTRHRAYTRRSAT